MFLTINWVSCHNIALLESNSNSYFFCTGFAKAMQKILGGGISYFFGNKIQINWFRDKFILFKMFICLNETSFLFNSMCLSQFASNPRGLTYLSLAYIVCFHLLIRFGQLMIRCATRFIYVLKETLPTVCCCENFSSLPK